MYGNPTEEWRELTEHYRSMVDEELLELRRDFEDLRPIAQQVLRDELKLRRLGDPLFQTQVDQAGGSRRSKPLGSRGDATSNDAFPGSAADCEYTWKTLLVICTAPEEAWQVAETLRQAGIECWIEGPQTYAQYSGSEYASLDLGNLRVLVAADQLDEARAIAARPVPQEIVDQSRMRIPEFVLPLCPRCGAADPLLEAVDPVNVWSCEACGAEWSDLATDADQADQTGGEKPV